MNSSILLTDLCEEYNIELPKNLKTKQIYKEIEEFQDAEYIYCVAYEMLIRTDEYNTLLEEYEPLKNKSKYDMTNDEFSKFRELIDKMNDLGLKKTSFLGFDCGEDDEHVFHKIYYYNEIVNSPWSVRTIDKFQIDPSCGYQSIYHMLIDYYNTKNNLYILKDDKYKGIKFQTQTTESSKMNINQINILDIKKSFDVLCIQYESNGDKGYKALKDFKYLHELDQEVLTRLQEEQANDLLIQAKANFSQDNPEFWYKYNLNDVKNGLNMLINFYLHHEMISDKNFNIINENDAKQSIIDNLSNYYIPCINRLMQPERIHLLKEDVSTVNNSFIHQLEYEGLNYIINNDGYTELKKEENIYFVQLNEDIPLQILHTSFLETLRYEDLKNTYIETEPKFSRPRLMFDDARLTTIPINLNLSKEDLLIYMAQIKDDYDKNKNIIKTYQEYFFDLELPSKFTQLPKNIKYASEKRTSKDKKVLPVKRTDFKKSFTSAFHIYDLFKFFLPYFEKKRNMIQDTINKDVAKEKKGTNRESAIQDIQESGRCRMADYTNDSLITSIASVTKLEVEQAKAYLSTMKELIHGINEKNEKNALKKQYNSNTTTNTKPKYKDLIIGNSYIIKNNKKDLWDILMG